MYRILKVVFDESTIRSVISLGRLLFWKLSVISTQLTILFLNAVGFALMIKSIDLGGGGWGRGGVYWQIHPFTIKGNENCILCYDIIMIHEHCCRLTSASVIAAPIKLIARTQ